MELIIGFAYVLVVWCIFWMTLWVIMMTLSGTFLLLMRILFPRFYREAMKNKGD